MLDETILVVLDGGWLSRHHPDPTGAQLKVLQQVLHGITSGSMALHSDIVTQFYKGNRKMVRAERDQILIPMAGLVLGASRPWFSIKKAPGSAVDPIKGTENVHTRRDRLVRRFAVPLLPWFHACTTMIPAHSAISRRGCIVVGVGANCGVRSSPTTADCPCPQQSLQVTLDMHDAFFSTQPSGESRAC
eukprot:s393_g5.t1